MTTRKTRLERRERARARRRNLGLRFDLNGPGLNFYGAQPLPWQPYEANPFLEMIPKEPGK